MLVPTRALLVDQVWQVKHGVVEKRTVKIGYRSLEISEVLEGLKEGDRVVVSDQEKCSPDNWLGSEPSRACGRKSQSDADAPHRPAVSFPSQTRLHSQSLRGCFRSRDFHLHPGADPGFSGRVSSIPPSGATAPSCCARNLVRATATSWSRRKTPTWKQPGAAISRGLRTPPRSCGSVGDFPTSSLARRSCAGRSRRGPNLKPRRSVSSGSIRRSFAHDRYWPADHRREV